LVVVTAVIAWVGVELRKVQKANANNENFTFLQRVAEVAVESAEQLYGEFAGEAKKAYALDFAEKWLAERGLNVETSVIEAQIEAAVLREFNFPAVEPTTPDGTATPAEILEDSDTPFDNEPDGA
jgi:hypothetical protein